MKDGVRTNHYRIHERHSSGTSYEIDTGNRIDLNSNYFNITKKIINTTLKAIQILLLDAAIKFILTRVVLITTTIYRVGANANVNIQVDNGNLM